MSIEHQALFLLVIGYHSRLWSKLQRGSKLRLIQAFEDRYHRSDQEVSLIDQLQRRKRW